MSRILDCELVLDYESEAFYNPPVAAGDVVEWGRRLAKACVGPGRGEGGTLVVRQRGLRGDWSLKFEIRRVEEGWETGRNGSAGVEDV